MDILNVVGTDETPKITLNPIEGIFEISGRSLPEDSAEFYKPVIQWLEKYKAAAYSRCEFTIKLDYFNTSSSKMILDILHSLQGVKESGKDTKVIWCFQEDDEDMEEAGQEFSELVNVPFDFKSY